MNLKIADLQAHNASHHDTLWACRSAIFKQLTYMFEVLMSHVAHSCFFWACFPRPVVACFSHRIWQRWWWRLSCTTAPQYDCLRPKCYKKHEIVLRKNKCCYLFLSDCKRLLLFVSKSFKRRPEPLQNVNVPITTFPVQNGYGNVMFVFMYVDVVNIRMQ